MVTRVEGVGRERKGCHGLEIMDINLLRRTSGWVDGYTVLYIFILVYRIDSNWTIISD